jgi:phosphoribosylformimino-5-aminoimidazole carboxamide ribotide isomerase
MLLIPAIDLRRGQCVRLREGDFTRETRYAIAPGAQLRRYEEIGATWVHLVDLDGARGGTPANRSLIEDLARNSSVRLQVGGGIRSPDLIEGLLAAGVARVVVGSAAVERAAEVSGWLKHFGANVICVALDVRVRYVGEPEVRTHGWTESGALNLWEALGAFPPGQLRHVLCTDIGRDGTRAGPNVGLYRSALSRCPALQWQASGGIRHAADLAMLAQIGVTAAISGTALLENRIPSKEIQPFLLDASSRASTCAPAAS